MSSLQQLVARDGGGRGLLGLGDLGIVFNKPKQSGGCILFYFSVSPLPPGKGVQQTMNAQVSNQEIVLGDFEP